MGFCPLQRGHARSMATTRTTKRKTTATKRSTAAKKGAATRARSTAATSARRTKATAKRRVNTPSRPSARSAKTTARKQTTGIAATAEYVGAKAGNAVQSGVLAGSKAAAAVSKRVSKIF
jgi:hypothetical protein